MGLFGNSSDVYVAEDVEKATSEKDVEEDWGVIMNICDKAGKSTDDAKAYLRAITRRLYNTDPHIGVKAVTLLDACIKNSGKIFHIEVASREFETDFTKLMTKANPSVAKKLRESLKKWAENEFKMDPQLNLIPSLLSKLKSQYDFSSSDTPVKKTAPISKDPNVVESQEEEEQILKAIELSLKETGGSPRTSTGATSKTSTNVASSLYPSVNMATGQTVAPVANSTPAKEQRKVRALYDFEAAEDNELTFKTGEIILVIDDSDPNWWKGSNHKGEGLFPANFVTADLNVEPEKFLFEKAKKIVQFKGNEVNVADKEPTEIEINEDKINRLLHLLHEADPTNPDTDTMELLNLEGEVNGMGPLIDTELERVDRKHAQLTQLSADLVEALGLYHTLMREPQFPSISKAMYGYPTPSNTMTHNGILPPPGLAQQHPSMIGHPGMGPPGIPLHQDGRSLPPQHHYLPPQHQQNMPPNQQQNIPPHQQQNMPPHHPQQNVPPQHQQNVPPQHQQNVPSRHPQQNMTPGQMGGAIQMGPAVLQGLPPHLQQQVLEEQQRRQHEQQPGMGHYPGMQTFPPPGMVPVNYPPQGVPPAQTSLNGPPQPQLQPHFVTSSTHMMH